MNAKGTGIRVLLVDDEAIILKTLAAFMEDWEYEIFTAENLADTLKILAREQIDIAIIDMRLRDCDGNTLILKAYDLQPQLKFLIHTGSATYSVPPEIEALGIGAEDVFMKPISDITTLFTAIQRKLS